MKKLLFGVCIALLAAGCGPNKGAKVNEQLAVAPTDTSVHKITLNGISYADAGKMVGAFLKDSISSDNFTNVWVSGDLIAQIDTLLTDEQKQDPTVDGIRIYLAKTLSGNKNTLVFVSTKQGSANTNAPSGYDHSDYFEHPAKQTFLESVPTLSTKLIEEDYSGKSNINATLYTAGVCKTNSRACVLLASNTIKCDEANDAVRNFNGGKLNLINEWFPLKLFLRLNEELTAGKANGADGVRIYFAKNSVRQNRNALIMMTTRSDKTDKMIFRRDYYECYSPALPELGKQRILALEKRYPKMKDRNDHLLDDPINNGEECPNNCKGTSWP